MMLFVSRLFSGTQTTIWQDVGGNANMGLRCLATGLTSVEKTTTFGAVHMMHNDRIRPNNDGTGTQWTGNWKTGRDAPRPMAFKGLFGPPFAPRTQRNFLVRR